MKNYDKINNIPGQPNIWSIQIGIFSTNLCLDLSNSKIFWSILDKNFQFWKFMMSRTTHYTCTKDVQYQHAIKTHGSVSCGPRKRGERKREWVY